MDLIGWEIIIYCKENEGRRGVRGGEQKETAERCDSILYGLFFCFSFGKTEQMECCFFVSQICFLFSLVYVSLSQFSVSLSLTQPHKHTLLHSLHHFTGCTKRNLLGFGDEQCVSEEKEVSLLGLQARLQLRLDMPQE